MKEYIKPFINEEEIELEDVIASSGVTTLTSASDSDAMTDSPDKWTWN